MLETRPKLSVWD